MLNGKRILRSVIAAGSALGLAQASAALQAQAEDFKNPSNSPDLTVAALGGLGVIDSTAGFALVGAVGKKILPEGFVSGITNPVFIEAELGPMFAKGATSLLYSGHLRWDFEKDQAWTFFAIGGLGGNITGEKLGNHFQLFPRFGVGAMATLTNNVVVRGEISHEMILAGVSFGL